MYIYIYNLYCLKENCLFLSYNVLLTQIYKTLFYFIVIIISPNDKITYFMVEYLNETVNTSSTRRYFILNAFRAK